ncbi:helix-turn-helix domain-containing protein [Actinokineospora sp. 24-640]
MSVNARAAARELGAELRIARENVVLSQRQFAARLGVNNATVSLWEAGKRTPSERDLLRVLDALDVVGDSRERVLGKWRVASERSGELVASSSGRAHLDQLIDQERAARRITTVSPLVIPGLLQTSDYARATLGSGPGVEKMVALRMGRADVLRGREPVLLRALIADDVLTTPVAPRDVMADQLRHLLKMADLANVSIQLIETHRGGFWPHLAGPFVLIEFPSASPIVHLEHLAAAVELWEPADVRRFASAADRMTEMAMSPTRSAEVIADLVDGMEA